MGNPIGGDASWMRALSVLPREGGGLSPSTGRDRCRPRGSRRHHPARGI